MSFGLIIAIVCGAVLVGLDAVAILLLWLALGTQREMSRNDQPPDGGKGD